MPQLHMVGRVSRFFTTGGKSVFKTHEVFNQSTPLTNYNMFTSDPALLRGLKHFGNGVLDGCNILSYNLLKNYGGKCGSAEMIEHANLAEKNVPKLRQFDTFGRRIDVVDFHPSYHHLMKNGREIGVASYGYNNEKHDPDAHSTRAALLYLQNQVDPGVCCPLVMTNAAIPVLRNVPGCEDLVEKLCHQGYDPRNVPMSEKQSITAGMSMTEKQGGSDVRANTTMATPVTVTRQGQGSPYYITGHKWFTSAPMSDVYLTLAKTGGSSSDSALSCFLVPRWCPDGSRNTGFKVMRLKDKLADRTNASSEVEYDQAWCTMVGEEGKGVRTIMEMVQSTRLDCAVGSAGLARRGLMETLHYTANRSVFGATLSQQPLMQNLLADLCVDAEAQTLMAMKMAHLYSHAKAAEHKAIAAGAAGDGSKAVMEDENMSAADAGDLFRIGVAVAKYFGTKRLPQFMYECMEAHGGNGFVEDLPMAKLYRHAPLNAIWEGSGNVIALDVLRAANKIPLLMEEIKLCSGIDSHVDAYISRLEKFLYVTFKHYGNEGKSNAVHPELQLRARYIADQLATALQASLMLRYGCPTAALMFIQSRIHPSNRFEDFNHSINYGSVPYAMREIQHVIAENMPVYTKGIM